MCASEAPAAVSDAADSTGTAFVCPLMNAETWLRIPVVLFALVMDPAAVSTIAANAPRTSKCNAAVSAAVVISRLRARRRRALDTATAFATSYEDAATAHAADPEMAIAIEQGESAGDFDVLDRSQGDPDVDPRASALVDSADRCYLMSGPGTLGVLHSVNGADHGPADHNAAERDSNDNDPWRLDDDREWRVV